MEIKKCVYCGTTKKINLYVKNSIVKVVKYRKTLKDTYEYRCDDCHFFMKWSESDEPENEIIKYYECPKLFNTGDGSFKERLENELSRNIFKIKRKHGTIYRRNNENDYDYNLRSYRKEYYTGYLAFITNSKY